MKAVDKMNPVFAAQLLTYLKLTGLRLGMLINFSVPLIKDGIKRIVLCARSTVMPLNMLQFLCVFVTLW